MGNALEKNEEGFISRFTNLCVSCKSCVVICPFGTMMTDFFDYHRNKGNYYDLLDELELEQFIKNSPEGAVQLTSMDENPEEHIFKLNDHILIREQMWNSDNL